MRSSRSSELCQFIAYKKFPNVVALNAVGCRKVQVSADEFNQSAKSTHQQRQIDDQHRECKTGVVRILPPLVPTLRTPPPPPPQKIPPDEEGLLWGWCVVRGLLCK